MTAEQRQNRITTIFILLSLLLHLLFLLIPKQLMLPASKAPDPVYVEVRPPQPRDRELDLPMREELEKPRETPAKRLAEKDQVVEKETAPEGQDFEDRERIVRAPKPAPRPVQPTPPVQEQPQERVQEQEQEPAPVTPEGWRARPEKPRKDLPDLDALTNISPQAFAKIETDWRRKYREDVEKGDTVWMDTQQDLLHSFMKRFRDNIYLVWNYPAHAAQQGQQGRNLVRITVDRQGNVVDVALLESSGYSALDEETLRAIRKGASYGPLPSAYPNKDLKIMAFFDYRISNVRTIKRRRPGDIY